MAALSKEQEDDETFFIETGSASSEPFAVRRNNLYIYDEITMDLAKDLVGQLEAMYLNLINICLSTGLENPTINIHIDSPGGDLMAGFAIIQMIKNLQRGLSPFKIPMKVNTFIVGQGDSCASLIACCGSKRYISRYAGCVIHDASTAVEGKIGDISTKAENLKDISEIYKEIYLSHSNLTEKQLDEMMKVERRYTPEQLIQFGLVDDFMETF